MLGNLYNEIIKYNLRQIMATVNAMFGNCILYNEKSALCVKMLRFAKKRETSMLKQTWIVLT